MREINIFPGRILNSAQQLARRLVRQMPVASADPLFQRPRAVAFLQHFRTMIALHHEQIDIADFLPDKFRRITEIGHPSEFSARRQKIIFAGGNNKTDRIVSIVRNRKCFHFEIAKTDRRTGLKKLPLQFPFHPLLHRLRSRTISEKRQIVVTSQAQNSGNMITMFVSDKNGIEAIDRFTGFFEHFANSFPTESRVDQHPAVFRYKKRTISPAATAENFKPKSHFSRKDRNRERQKEKD